MNFDDGRVSQALSSLEQSFSYYGSGRIHSRIQDDHSAGLGGTGLWIEIVEQTLSDEFPVRRREPLTPGELLRLELPLDAFFAEDGQLTGSALRSLDALALALSDSSLQAQSPPGWRFSLDLILSHPPGAERQAALQGGELAVRLIRSGAVGKSVAIASRAAALSERPVLDFQLRLLPEDMGKLVPVRTGVDAQRGMYP